MNRFAAVLLALAAGVGCASSTASREGMEPDYGRPFDIILTEYAVPMFLGTAAAGEVGGWTEGPRSPKEWLKGWTHRPAPHDVDNGFVNYVLHPFAGSETHMIARNHGWSFGEAFLFDVFGSVAWEYVFENVYEPPSRIDLMVTAPVGALLGELRWALKEAGVLPGLMDPFGDHGEPFFELGRGQFLFGLHRKF